jgi:hypothetical protein
LEFNANSDDNSKSGGSDTTVTGAAIMLSLQVRYSCPSFIGLIVCGCQQGRVNSHGRTFLFTFFWESKNWL